MRLLSTSWMNAEAGTSGRGDFVASTIDVDAIKVSFLLWCGKLRIFLSLRFYVKSILENLEVLKLQF